jgi:hypothetical protein
VVADFQIGPGKKGGAVRRLLAMAGKQAAIETVAIYVT